MHVPRGAGRDSTLNQPPTDSLRVSALAVLPVREVVAIVQEWVDLHATRLPGFAGAYLWGGITALPKDAPYNLYRDVDVVVVTAGTPGEEQELLYRGLMLEVVSLSLDAHQQIETVLADPSLGPNMATTRILADPTGTLTPLHRTVAAHYGERRWIQARCDAEQASAVHFLHAMHEASTPTAILDSVRPFLNMLSGMLALAQLRRPTVRRTLALLRELLEAHGRSDLHEMALALMGSAHMDRPEVQALQDQTLAAFDRAVEVFQTSTPYGFGMRHHLRPYHSAGAQEMIDEGNHREAVFWISCLDTAYNVLQNDALQAEKQQYAEQFEAMCTALGYLPHDAWVARVGSADRLSAEVRTIVNDLIALHPH